MWVQFLQPLPIYIRRKTMQNDFTANQIVLPIEGNRYISIVQNRKNFYYDGLGSRYGDYGKRVEIAILDENYNYIGDGTFEYGVKGHLTTQQLAIELLKLIAEGKDNA
tara:strand:+ start:248 stop:571 length:324 start_codon:yes stop_codon:yes gene_type:complete